MAVFWAMLKATMAKSGRVDGMKIVGKPTGAGCAGCRFGKGRCASHASPERERVSDIFERLHVDLVGRLQLWSLGGCS